MILFFSQMTNVTSATNRVIHIRFIANLGSAIQCRIERLMDGLIYDFDPTVMAFSSTPGQSFGLTIEQGLGLFSMNLSTSPESGFPSGEYCVSLHDTRAGNQAIQIHMITLA